MEERFIKYIKDKYAPVAILLCGSRASDYATPQSDWDFVVIVSKEIMGEQKTIDGHILDIGTLVLDSSIGKILETYKGTFQKCKVVFDTENKGESLLKDVQSVYAKGRNLSEEEKNNRIAFITKRLRKLEDNIDYDGVFFYNLGVFYEKAIQYWFEILKNKWPLSPNQALQVIEREDSDYFASLKILYSNVSNSERIKAAKTIHTALS